MNLLDFYNNLKNHTDVTDKGTIHTYIQEYYNDKFTPLKNIPISILEIGILNGLSMDFWMSWFTNANFIGIDPCTTQINRLEQNPNFKGYSLDAFTFDTLNLFSDESLDIIIEDGPHTLDTQTFAAKNWIKKLKKGGLLIIEDIQNPDEEVYQIIKNIKDDKSLEINLFDLRPKINRYDDYIIEIKKL